MVIVSNNDNSNSNKYNAKVAPARRLLEAVLALPEPSASGRAAALELCHALRRIVSNVQCRLLNKRDAPERIQVRRQFVVLAKQLRAHARSAYGLDLRTSLVISQPVGTDATATAPASLEEMRSRCPLYREDRCCWHLCEHLCFFREYDPARSLQALCQRAAAHPLRPSLTGWMARLAHSRRPPFWCVVLHDAAGSVRGSPEEAWAALRAAALAAPLPSASAASAGRAQVSRASAADGPWGGDGGQGQEGLLGRSPFGLIEELLAGNPWQLLVTCMLLNRTAREVVDSVLARLFRRWPSPASLAGAVAAEQADLEALLQPLGL